MYDFRDLLPATGTDDTAWQSAEAILINGKLVESLVPGYQTLTVTGRGPLGYKINAEAVDGADGARYLDAFLDDRAITVAYRLHAKTAQDFIEALDKLAAVLATKQAKVSFADQPDWYFTATLSATSDPDEGRLDAKGSFTITASDPHKYSADHTLSGASIDFGSAVGVLTAIEYTPAATATAITITSSKGYAIKLVGGTVKAGDTLVLKPPEQTVTLNGVNKAMWLTYDTDFENVPAAGKLTVKPAGNLKVTYRERR